MTEQRNCDDCIWHDGTCRSWDCDYISRDEAAEAVKALPSAQPEPISEAYAKAVWTWLLDYQIKAAKLKGRYSPYEILSWVANGWRKENGLDQTSGGD